MQKNMFLQNKHFIMVVQENAKRLQLLTFIQKITFD